MRGGVVAQVPHGFVVVRSECSDIELDAFAVFLIPWKNSLTLKLRVRAHSRIILHTANLHRGGDAVFGEGALPKKSAPTEVARLLHAALRTPS